MRTIVALAVVIAALAATGSIARDRKVETSGLYAAQLLLYDCVDDCGPAGHYKLWRPDASGTMRRLDMLGRGGSFVTPTPPTISPDGRWIAFGVSRRRLAVQRVDLDRGRLTGQRKILPAILDDVYDAIGVPTWSPDSRELALVGEVNGQHGLWIIGRDGSGLRQIVCSCDVRVESDVDDGTWPAWSRSGRIAFTGTRPDDLSAIYAVDAAGGPLTRMSPLTSTETPAEPAWSPDGDRIAFTFVGDHRIVLQVRKAGVRVGRVRGAHAPVWSPDGRSLAYVRGDARILVAPASDPGAGRRVPSGSELGGLGWVIRLQWFR